jgi:hypothetical protein
MMRMQRWQGRLASSTNRIWPCFSLFLLRTVLETLLQTDSGLRRNGSLIRKMLVTIQPKLAAVPLEHGYPALPVAWNTIHRFWPLPIYFGRRAAAKAQRVIKKKLGLSTSINMELSLRWQLSSEEEVKELLRPGEMRLAMAMEPGGLDHFVSASRTETFQYDAQWARLLTLETTLRCIEDAKRHEAAESGRRENMVASV